MEQRGVMNMSEAMTKVLQLDQLFIPCGGYEIIYADPPWSFYNNMSVEPDCTTVKGIRRPPYRVLSTKDIMNIQVNKIASNNAVLLMWTTDYHLARAIEVISAWGFEYKTIGFAWQKLTKELKPVSFCGAYTLKSGIELCLLATKGNTSGWVKCRKVKGLIQSKREHHSKKPDEIRDRIVSLFGDRPRIELFARNRTEGWVVWGNEV
ncbi:MAG: DNA methyltransferase [Bacteroidetes bacterium]|nr:DNA methyltransferase [Bacteroidota bacterium]